MDHLDFEVTDDNAAALGSSSIMSWLRNRRRSSAATKEAFVGVEESSSRRGSRRFSVDFLTNQTGTDLLAKPSKQQQIPQIRVNDSKSSTQEGPLKFR